MTKAEMMSRGAAHCKAGKQLTPFDCREIDAELFAEARRQSEAVEDKLQRITLQARVYSKLRSAFSDGWNVEYLASIA